MQQKRAQNEFATRGVSDAHIIQLLLPADPTEVIWLATEGKKYNLF